MDVVPDQLRGQLGARHDHADDARLPSFQWPHGVVAVGHMPGTGVDGRAHFGVGGVGVAERGDNAVAGQPADQFRAPGISGASVMTFNPCRFSPTCASRSSMLGGTMNCSGCAPFFTGLIYGPSRWQPSTAAPPSVCRVR